MSLCAFDIVGFDLDGTLVDTAEDLAAAVNAVLLGEGAPGLAVTTVRSMIGGGGRAMLAHALDASNLDPGRLDALYPVMLEACARAVCVHSRPFAGAVEVLDWARECGLEVAVVTNKTERLARALLDALDLSGRFTCIIGGDTLGPGRCKPNPAPLHAMVEQCGGGRAVFVGDSHFDITAAHAAGIASVLCRFGYLTQPAELYGADAVIDEFADLPGLLEAWPVPRVAGLVAA